MQAGTVFLVALSEVQVVAFAPLLLLMLRHRRSWPAALALVAGATAQALQSFYTTLADPRLPVDAPPTDAAQVAVGYVVHPVAGSWIPDYARAATLFHEHPLLFGAAATLPFVVAAGVVLRSRWSPRSTLAVVLLAGSIGLWALALVINPRDVIGSLGQPEGLVPVVGYLRYAAVPSMFLLGLLALAMDRLLDSGTTAGRRGAFVLAAAILSVLVLGLDPPHTRSDPGPRWSESLAVARQECAHGARETQVKTAPEGWGPFIACDAIR